MPPKKYLTVNSSCPYKAELPDYAFALPNNKVAGNNCFENIFFPYFKASLYCTYIPIYEDTVWHGDVFRNKAYEHRIKANAIFEREFINVEKRVYGAIFELQGNVACNYSFYLTDSVQHFFGASLYFETAPNYDSLKPFVEFIQEDLEHFIESFEWK